MGCYCCCSSRQAKTEVNSNFPRFQGNTSQEPLKLFYEKLYLILLYADYKKMQKYCLSGSMTFVCNKGAQGGGLQKPNIYHMTLKDLGILHNWPDKYV